MADTGDGVDLEQSPGLDGAVWFQKDGMDDIVETHGPRECFDAY